MGIKTAGPQGLEFRQERIRDGWDEAIPLMLQNNQEAGVIDNTHFGPSLERYEKLEELEMIKTFTARKDGKLVGYSVMMVTNHGHYPSKVFALQDVVFMTKEYRGRPAIRFLKWCDEELKDLGVQYILRQSSTKHPFDRVLKHIGYEQVETVYMRGH